MEMFLEYWRMYVFFHAKDCLYEVTLTVLTVTLFNSCVYQHRISFCIGYIGRPTNYVSLATQNECKNNVFTAFETGLLLHQK